MVLPEETLIEYFQEGKETAFKELFQRFYLPLCSFAYRYVKNDHITDDFVQDAFFNVWEKRKDFFLVSAIKSYLYLNVRNACLNWLKHQQVQYRNESELALSFYNNEEQEQMLEEDIHARIYDAIKDLSPQTRKIVLMTMEGLSNPEIASRLNISSNTVKTTKLRAYRILRKKLKDIQWILFLLLVG